MHVSSVLLLCVSFCSSSILCVCVCVHLRVCMHVVCVCVCVCVCIRKNGCAVYREVVVTSISAGQSSDHFSPNCLHNDQDKLAYLIKQS